MDNRGGAGPALNRDRDCDADPNDADVGEARTSGNPSLAPLRGASILFTDGVSRHDDCSGARKADRPQQSLLLATERGDEEFDEGLLPSVGCTAVEAVGSVSKNIAGGGIVKWLIGYLGLWIRTWSRRNSNDDL